VNYKKASDKWMAIARGEDVDKGSLNCPLCLKHVLCLDCPVVFETNQVSCKGSPYEDWQEHKKSCNLYFPDFCEDAQRLALNEWLFLKSIGE